MAGLEGTVHTPMGDVKKKQLVIGGALALLVGVYVYRKKQSAAAAASSQTAGSGASPSAATDPATGYPYGSAEDTAALQASAMASYGGYAGGAGGGGGGSLSTPPTSTPGFATNAAWAQAAEAYLTQNGADPTTVSAALGKYLTGQQVTDAQAAVIQSAIAFEGYPPVSGQDSYPPSIRQAPVPTGGGPKPPPPPPPVDKAPPTPTGMHLIGPTLRNAISFGWNAVPGGCDHYEVHMDGREIGTTANTNTYGGNLKPGTRHTFQVMAVSKGGHKSAPASLTATTAK